MLNDYTDDPKLTSAVFKLQDVLEAQQQEHIDPDFMDITSHRDEVLVRYQPNFAPSHIPELTKSEFEEFLPSKNNYHWNSLHRVRKHMTASMPLLRQALALLLDESHPVRERLNQIRPELYFGQPAIVSRITTLKSFGGSFR